MVVGDDDGGGGGGGVLLEEVELVVTGAGAEVGEEYVSKKPPGAELEGVGSTQSVVVVQTVSTTSWVVVE